MLSLSLLLLQLPLAGTVQHSSLLQTTLLCGTGAHVLSKLCDNLGNSLNPA